MKFICCKREALLFWEIIILIFSGSKAKLEEDKEELIFAYIPLKISEEDAELVIYMLQERAALLFSEILLLFMVVRYYFNSF